jgi:hypothetical protein
VKVGRVVVISSLVGIVGACGGGEGDQNAQLTTVSIVAPGTVVSSTSAAMTTVPTAAVTTAPTTTAGPVGFGDQWERVEAPAECMCGDGGEWAYFVRRADPTKVLFFLEGGGACFTGEMCAPGSDDYKQSVGHDGGFDADSGIFDLDDPRNPLADYSMVFVPYCTGDVHAGNSTTDYGNGVVVEHKGFVNGSAALAGMIERFPDAAEVVVAGVSAGSFPTPVYAAIAADALPEARITVIADGSGAIPDAMGAVAANWKFLEALPDWPEVAGATYADVTPSWVFKIVAARQPAIAFARHDYAFDDVLTGYAQLAGLSADDLVAVMQANEAAVEAAGAVVSTWIAAGDDHTVIQNDELYTEELNGVRFVDWLTSVVDGRPPPDESCAECAG